MSFSRNILKALLVGAVAISFAGQASASVDNGVSRQMSQLVAAVAGDADKSYTKIAAGDSHRGPRVRRAPHGCDGPPRKCHSH